MACGAFLVLTFNRPKPEEGEVALEGVVGEGFFEFLGESGGGGHGGGLGA